MQVIAYAAEGEKRRVFGCNNVHEHASRSHTVFQLIFESRALTEAEIRVSTLNIVDLAGSELAFTHLEPGLCRLGLFWGGGGRRGAAAAGADAKQNNCIAPPMDNTWSPRTPWACMTQTQVIRGGKHPLDLKALGAWVMAPVRAVGEWTPCGGSRAVSGSGGTERNWTIGRQVGDWSEPGRRPRQRRGAGAPAW